MVAQRAVLLQRLVDDLFQLRRNAGIQPGGRRRCFAGNGVEYDGVCRKLLRVRSARAILNPSRQLSLLSVLVPPIPPDRQLFFISPGAPRRGRITRSWKSANYLTPSKSMRYSLFHLSSAHTSPPRCAILLPGEHGCEPPGRPQIGSARHKLLFLRHGEANGILETNRGEPPSRSQNLRLAHWQQPRSHHEFHSRRPLRTRFRIQPNAEACSTPDKPIP